MITSLRAPLLALVVVGGLAGGALASPAVGFHPKLLSRATLSAPVHHNAGAVKLRTKGSVDITHQRLRIDPRGSSGWHTHRGVVLVTVKSGSLVRYNADCTRQVFPAGSAFTESGRHVGLVRNESASTPAVTYLTYITPVGAPLRDEARDPRCASVD